MSLESLRASHKHRVTRWWGTLLFYKIMNVIMKSYFFAFNVVKLLMESLDGIGIVCNKLMTAVGGSRAACNDGKPDIWVIE